jgi:hypothetical protein
MNQQQPLTDDNLKRLLDFVSEDERRQLEETAYEFRKTGVITANPAGPKRYRGKIFGTDHCTPLITELGKRVSAQLALDDYEVDPYLGYTVSLIEPGGFIHEHIDRYGSYREGMRHLRCNIMVHRENESYDPVISSLIVPVPERAAWAFMASECRHGTQDIDGRQPRIIFGFGWTVPGSYSLANIR